ncbi:MAG: phenylalanine--tRNA ligase subunit beta [Calditrichaceae bacterium]|nr:phenylalanine--tRNA ligase subunit beta [Calditrichaceae bacterium]MBN2709864.1 phenylalanine--tRNA ligase subunit beta [Calditrichaceae bacterium]RQV92621.1 MAG: phenylalanine--tRNA ligase subunit beta [Calditrichota bacterium]
MKATYQWLKEYADIPDSAEKLADKLTDIGFEVEEIRPLIKEFSGVVVAKVESVEKHPDADKLSICEVNNGKQVFQVICGAPNVKKDQFVPFAQVGATLPNGFAIKKAKIRGVDSFGMICSKEELGVEEKSDGIWELESRYQLGDDFSKILMKNNDYLYDFFITPNRPDCLSIVGIGREIAAIYDKPLRYPSFDVEEDKSLRIEDFIRIEIEDKEGCPRYAGRVIKDVKIGPSPEWMQKKLEAVGMRSINNIVDITNFALMELGHPLHAFDLRNLTGNRIIVRKSAKNEKFITLDEKERILPENTVMICDSERSVAIGGIMGGLNSEVKEDTVDIFLESAYFKPERIRVSSKELGLKTEASQRFERGTDPNGVLKALNRAASLMASLAGGTVVSGICDVYPAEITPDKIPLDCTYVNKILGSDLSEKVIRQKLSGLELDVRKDEIIVPTFRVDLKTEIDLVEEVARLINYSNLPSKRVTNIPYEIEQRPLEKQINLVRQTMINLGLQEALTTSMIRKEEAQFFSDKEPVSILNPVSDDMSVMRNSLFPGLLHAVSYNRNRHNKNLRFFEIGRVFDQIKGQDNLPDQPYKAAVVICGKRYSEGWNTSAEPVDFYDIKGFLESFLDKLFLDNSDIILYDTSSYFDNNLSMNLIVSQQITGACGRFSDKIIKFFDIDEEVYGFEINLDALFRHLDLSRQYTPIPKFPFVERDLAFVLEDSITAKSVADCIRKRGGELLKNLQIFDVFRGGKLGNDKKSLAIRMRFQSAERTLTDKEVDGIFNRIIVKVNKEFNASLRN